MSIVIPLTPRWVEAVMAHEWCPDCESGMGMVVHAVPPSGVVSDGDVELVTLHRPDCLGLLMHPTEHVQYVRTDQP